MHANDNYQIQEISFKKGKEMKIHASFANVLSLSKISRNLSFVMGRRKYFLWKPRVSVCLVDA
jgi:hypothetical protein